MRKTLTTAAMLLALSCPVFAGEMHTPPAPAPAPASVTQEPTDTETANGYMPNGVAESMTQIALDLLTLLPSLL